ncbi:hypothetical protein JXB02_05830 [Candidatus Woesearchaeota archaeon]|nr:hypothetical protein [Candidatus Woesearchaeota archaeon]
MRDMKEYDSIEDRLNAVRLRLENRDLKVGATNLAFYAAMQLDEAADEMAGLTLPYDSEQARQVRKRVRDARIIYSAQQDHDSLEKVRAYEKVISSLETLSLKDTVEKERYRKDAQRGARQSLMRRALMVGLPLLLLKAGIVYFAYTNYLSPDNRLTSIKGKVEAIEASVDSTYETIETRLIPKLETEYQALTMSFGSAVRRYEDLSSRIGAQAREHSALEKSLQEKRRQYDALERRLEQRKAAERTRAEQAAIAMKRPQANAAPAHRPKILEWTLDPAVRTVKAGYTALAGVYDRWF